MSDDECNSNAISSRVATDTRDLVLVRCPTCETYMGWPYGEPRRACNACVRELLRKRAERAERFARLWKRMAKTLMDRSWYQHGKKHGVAAERAATVAHLRERIASHLDMARLADEPHRQRHLDVAEALTKEASRIERGEHLR